MRTKLIAFELVLLVASIGLFIWSSQTERVQPETGEQPDSPAFPNLPVNQVKRIELKKGDKTIVFKKQNLPSEESQGKKGRGKKKKSKGTRDVTKQKGAFRPDFRPDWVIESYHNYGVRDELVQDRIIKPLRSLKLGEVRSKNRENLQDFGLNKKNRDRIVLKDDANKVIADIVLGTRTTKFEEQRGRFGGGGGDTEYVYYYDATRSEGKFQVRLGESEFGDLPVDPQEWVFKKIMSFEDRDVNIVALQRHKRPDTDKEKKENGEETSEDTEDGSSGKEQDADAEKQANKVNKLYVVRRSEKTKSGDAKNGSDGKNGADGEQEKDDEESPQFTDWTLQVGDYYGNGPMPLKTFVRLKDKELAWKGSDGKIVRNPVKKKKASQSSADSLFRTLSSLEAERVEPPLTIGPNQSQIPDEKLKKYGLADPVGILYLGRWGTRRGMNVAAFNARYFVGKKNEDEEGDATYYISSLQTSDVQSAQFFGLFGAQKSRKQIPVYTLSSSDQDTVLGGSDLIETKDEKDDQKGANAGSAGDAPTSEKKKKLKKKLREKLKNRKQQETSESEKAGDTGSSSKSNGSSDGEASSDASDSDGEASSTETETGDGEEGSSTDEADDKTSDSQK